MNGTSEGRADETAWVIVTGHPTDPDGLFYFTGRAVGEFGNDHADALRLARKSDAERLIRYIADYRRVYGHVLPLSVRAEEHVWLATPLTSQGDEK